jgi:hypothetical protein
VRYLPMRDCDLSCKDALSSAPVCSQRDAEVVCAWRYAIRNTEVVGRVPRRDAEGASLERERP